MSVETIRPMVRWRPWSPSRATIWLRAGLEELYRLLSDYDGWASWAPGVEAARLLAQEGDLALAEVRFGPEREPTVFECVRATEKELRMRRIGGPAEIRALRWHLRPAEDGTIEIGLALKLPWRAVWRAPASRPAARWLLGFAELAARACEEFPLRVAGELPVVQLFDVRGRLEIRSCGAGRETPILSRDREP